MWQSISATPPSRRAGRSRSQTSSSAVVEYFLEEMSAFITAWKGSIEFQASSGNSKLAEGAMPVSEVKEAISILLASVEEKSDESHSAAP